MVLARPTAGDGFCVSVLIHPLTTIQPGAHSRDLTSLAPRGPASQHCMGFPASAAGTRLQGGNSCTSQSRSNRSHTYLPSPGCAEPSTPHPVLSAPVFHCKPNITAAFLQQGTRSNARYRQYRQTPRRQGKHGLSAAAVRYASLSFRFWACFPGRSRNPHGCCGRKITKPGL